MRSLAFQSAVGPMSPFEWDDIPPLVVLTGENGAGKSTLVNEIARACSADSAMSRMLDGPSRVWLEMPPQRNVGYLPSRWGLSKPTIPQSWFVDVRKHIERLLEDPANQPDATQPVDAKHEDTFDVISRTVRRVLRARYRPNDPLAVAEVLSALGPYDLVTHDPQQPLQGLAHAVLGHLNARATRLLKRIPWQDVDDQLGQPPWERVDRMLEEFGLRYRLEYTTDHRLPFELGFRDPQGRVVSPDELSSGEQASIALIALVATTTVVHDATGRHEALPELLLLDEPDAHLHTSLIKGYLANIQNIVARGVQVIMVTHRPDTMALAPAGSLYVMRRDLAGNTSITRVESRSRLIAHLAADTIAVLPSVRVVLVEDEDDRAFYEKAYQLALTFPSADLPRHPPLAFMAAMAKPDEEGKQTRKSTGDGGWTAVVARMKDLAAQQLQAVFRGLIDGDGKHDQPAPGIIRIQRYSIESFWADPLGLYEWSVRRDDGVGEALAAAGGVAVADLGDIRNFDAARLQPVVDAVAKLLETKLLPALSRERRDVTIHRKSGVITLSYPEWLWTATKDQLEDAVTAAFTKAVRIPWKNAAQVVACLPADLIAVFDRLITEHV